MEAIDFRDQDSLNSLVSHHFGPWSSSVFISQELINQFADISGDAFWLHTDIERCVNQSPFGSTIAQGFLVLSLLSKMTTKNSVVDRVNGYNHMMNYGSDKLRFLGAVPVNSHIYSRNRVKSVAVGDNKTRMVLETHVHLKGAEKPVMVYELIIIFQ